MKSKSFVSRLLWIFYNQFHYGYIEKFRKKMKMFFWRRFLISTGKNVVIHPSVLIRGAENIVLKNNVNVNHGSELYGAGGLTIGEGSMIAYNVMIFTDSRKFKSQKPLKSLKGRIVKPVVIGDDVWVGAGAIILPGVIIANHAIVAAGAVVTSDIDEWNIVAGNPAKKVSTRLDE